MKKYFAISILYLLLSGATFAQQVQTVCEKNVYKFDNTSYEYGADGGVNLKPGFSAKAVIGDTFFAKTTGDTINCDTTDKFYLKKEVILIAGIKTESAIDTLVTGDKITTVTYLDGLGRNVQGVVVEASPEKKDLVQVYEYNQFGEQTMSYLPFTSFKSDGSYNINAPDDIEDFYLDDNDGIVNDSFPYAESIKEKSPVAFTKEQGAPGKDWQIGEGHTVQQGFRVNDSLEVRMWLYDDTASVFVTEGFYPKDQLIKSLTTDENGNTVTSFYDKFGRVISKRVLLKDTTEAETMFIYDDFGRLTYMIQPEGVTDIPATGSFTLDSTKFIDQWVFCYGYDKEGKPVASKVPGSDTTVTVFDQFDRPVLLQDGNQRIKKQWTFVKYDALNRIVATGLYKDNADTTRAMMQANLDSIDYDYATTFPYETKFDTVNSHGYTNRAFPAGVADSSWLTFRYYDNYDFQDDDGYADYPYVAQGISNETTPDTVRITGRPTGNKVRVLGSDDWLVSAAYYGEYGNTVHIRGNNHLNLNADDIATVVYNERFRAVGVVSKRVVASGDTLITRNRITYDHVGRATTTWHQIEDNPEVLTATYSYNELGQLTEKNIHSTDSGSSFLQSIDFSYHIRGWLTHINNSRLVNDTIHNNDTTDVFGMELAFNTPDASLPNANNYYNGNISAVKWQTFGSGQQKERSYVYTYDKGDRLTAANYQGWNTSDWTKETDAYNTTYAYDLNGNFEGLTRYGLYDEQTGPKLIDSLSYAYKDSLNNFQGNRLMKVADLASDSIGFDEATGLNQHYTYDKNGNLLSDANKDIVAITWNFLDLPEMIVKSTGDTVKYTYDATGTLLTKTTTENTEITIEHNVGSYVYHEQTSTINLQYFSFSEGRVLYDGADYAYEYHLTDHLGNVRVTLAESVTVSYLATVEDSMATEEEQYFMNLDSCRVPVPNFLNHTGNYDGNNMRLNNYKEGNSYTIGGSIALMVMPGDTIRGEVFAKYVNHDKNADEPDQTPVTQLNNLIGSGAVTEGGGFNGANFMGGLLDMVSQGSEGTEVPYAYLNYILFDKNFEVADMGYVGVTSDAEIPLSNPTLHDFQKRDFTVVADEPGYIYVYVSSESAIDADIYFDDLSVSKSTGNVTNTWDYYPYGMEMSGVVSSDISSAGKNPYQFNGVELEEELNLNISNTPFRKYDAAVGRWWGVDLLSPMMPSLSPYHFSYNDPVSYADPTGLNGRDMMPGPGEFGPPPAGSDGYYYPGYFETYQMTARDGHVSYRTEFIPYTAMQMQMGANPGASGAGMFGQGANYTEIIVLLDPEGASGFGHSAVLIRGDSDNWYYYSKDGTNGRSGSHGGSDEYVIDKEFDNIQEFANSDYNLDSDGNQRYNKGYLLRTTTSSESLRKVARREALEDYDVIGNSCIDLVSEVLKEGDLDPGFSYSLNLADAPNDRYLFIVAKNPGVHINGLLKRGKNISKNKKDKSKDEKNDEDK